MAPSFNSIKPGKRGNRGRTSLRSSSTRDSKPESSSAKPEVVESHSVSKSAQNKTKRPKKYASISANSLSAGIEGRGSSYNALLDAFSKKSKKNLQKGSKSSSQNGTGSGNDGGLLDEEYGGSENEDVFFKDDDDEELSELEDGENNFSEGHEADDEEASDGNKDLDPEMDDDDASDDERNQVEGFISGGPSEPTGDEPDNEDSGFEEDEKNTDDQLNDPYFKHFQNVDLSLYETLPPVPTVVASSRPSINLMSFSAPTATAETLEWKTRPYTQISTIPNRSILLTLPEPHNQLSDNLFKPKSVLTSSSSVFEAFDVRPKLQETWVLNNPKLTELQKDLISPIFNYQDLLFPSLTVENHSELRRLYCLHILNHVYKAQRSIYNNDIQLRLPDADADLEFRDQGFTKPKVLLVLPTKDACYKVLTQLASISNLQEINNKRRFKNAFYDSDKPPSSRPDDFIELFSGNSDDMFCLGIKITMKAMKFYANFYDADILVASPLGLDLILGKEGGEKKPEHDFLSSIEIVVVDQADAMIMQNWDHVEHIFDKLNITPKEAHGCDFSRLKPWFTEEKAAYLRQSLILTRFATPEMNSLFSNKCFNIAGKLKVRPVYRGETGNLGLEVPGAETKPKGFRQTFSRLVFPRGEREVYENDPSKEPDLRFTYFTTIILPSILRGAEQDGIFVYIPSYMDFTRVRNYLDAKNSISFSCISEYTSVPDMNRAREYFSSGRSKILLYTERFHHFRRYEIKGVQSVIFYGLPENPKFYREITQNLIRTIVAKKLDPNMVNSRAIYSQWDAFKLERIVGSKELAPMIRGTSEAFQLSY